MLFQESTATVKAASRSCGRQTCSPTAVLDLAATKARRLGVHDRQFLREICCLITDVDLRHLPSRAGTLPHSIIAALAIAAIIGLPMHARLQTKSPTEWVAVDKAKGVGRNATVNGIKLY